jgi:hypothetical protein
MPAIITEKFRQSNATAFSNDISSSKYYMFIGKSQPWTSEGATTDSEPPTPIDSVAPESYYWDDMLASKLISSKSFVVPRRDWSATTAFDMYRHDIGAVNSGNYGTTKTTSSSGASNLYDSTFYFKTSAHNVYKVLFNGDNAQTGASAIGGTEPDGTGPAPFFHENTGYFLKYMYTMGASDVQNFLTTDFMPVKVSANPADNNNIRGVFVFLVTSSGSGYPNGTFYTKLRGDGSGGIARLVVSGNQITVFGDTTSKMQNYGSGYSFASFDLRGTNIYTNANATTLLNNTYVGEGGATGLLTTWNNATAATIKAIIDPAGSHGSNDVEELGGHYVMIQSKFEPADADATQVNDFRRVGIVKNPEDSGGSPFTASTARNTNAVLLTGTITTNFQIDEVITQASTLASGRVVEWDATNKILYYVQEKYTTYGLDADGDLKTFSGTNAISGETSTASYTPSSATSTVNGVSFAGGYAVPEMKRDSGEIIYVENRRPISRASDQTEDIKVVVEF